MHYLALTLASVASALAGATSKPVSHFVAVRIAAESMAPQPGRIDLIGFEMTPQPGWHGYWSNPGESGIAPTVKWTAPAGVHFGPLLHPAPTLLQSMGLVSYVHAGKHLLLTRMSLDRSIAPGTSLPVTAQLSWAACSDKLCVPEHATLSLQMVAGAGSPSADAAPLRQGFERLPERGGAGTYFIEDGKLLLDLPQSLRLQPASLRFFPDENGYYDPMRAHSSAAASLSISSPLKGQPPKLITGVVSDGSSAYRLVFRREVATRAAAESSAATQRPAGKPQAQPQQDANDGAKSMENSTDAPHPGMPHLARALVALALIFFALASFALARRRSRRS